MGFVKKNVSKKSDTITVAIFAFSLISHEDFKNILKILTEIQKYVIMQVSLKYRNSYQ